MARRTIARNSRESAESGVALIAVLWTTVLLSMLAAGLVAMSRSDAKLLSAERVRLQATEAAEAGINLALVGLSDGTGNWPIDGTPETLTFGDAEIDVAVTAESGKVDLNTADRDLIRGLLVVAGENPGAANRLADAIVDRRPARSTSEQTDKNAASAAHGVLFNDLGELVQLPGMTRALFDRLEPDLTLYSGSSSADPKFAPIDVLLAIPGNTRADAEARLQARSSPGQGLHAGAEVSGVLGHAFSIVATARREGVSVRRTEIVRVTGNPAAPVWVLATR